MTDSEHTQGNQHGDGEAVGAGMPADGEAAIDQVGASGGEGTEGESAANPPLPDWGPTDGQHGTDADPE